MPDVESDSAAMYPPGAWAGRHVSDANRGSRSVADLRAITTSSGPGWRAEPHVGCRTGRMVRAASGESGCSTWGMRWVRSRTR